MNSDTELQMDSTVYSNEFDSGFAESQVDSVARQRTFATMTRTHSARHQLTGLHGLNIADTTPSKSHGAYEFKFLIDESQTGEIIAWARENLNPDPHADPELADGYRVNSLYLDTSYFDVFHRTTGFRQQKFRLRRYGRETVVWFEQKIKRKGFVRKRRTSVPDTEVANRLAQLADMDWDGHWFRSQVDERGLQPVSQITYDRFARIGVANDGPIRLTIDDNLTARLAQGWQVPAGAIEGIPLLEGKRILELKFRGAMPGVFRRLIENHQLRLTRFSKYRTSVEECVPLDCLAGDETRGMDDA